MGRVWQFLVLALLAVAGGPLFADDANSTVTEVSEANALDSASGSTLLWTLRLTDFETADGIDTTITDLVFTVTPSGNNDVADFDWTLNSGAATGVANNPANTVTFTGLSITAADNGAAPPNPSTQDFTLEASIKTSVTDPTTLDNESLSISLTTITESGAGTTIATASVNKSTPVALDVVATALNIVTGPAAIETVNDNFDVVVEYVDNFGNRDTDVAGDVVTATRSDAGAVNQGNSAAAAAGLANFTGGNQVNLGLPLATGITLSLTDNAGGSINLSGSPVTSAAFDLRADTDSTLTETSSTVSIDAFNLYQTVWVTSLNDLGTGDGLATIVDSLTINITAGAPGATGFDWQLDAGSGFVAPDSVTATTLVFDNGGAGNFLTVGNGASQALTLQARVNVTNNATIDNVLIDMSISDTDIVHPVNSSTMAVATLNNSVNTEVIVIATEIKVATQPGVSEPVNVGFNVAVEFVDINGNRDLDVAGDVITAVRSDAGPVNQGTSAATVAGLANFTGGNQMDLGPPANATNTLTLTLTDDVGGGMNFSGAPISSNNFVLEDGDGGYSENSSAASISSLNTYQDVWQIDMTDGGSTDAVATIIDSITYNVAVSGGTYDATDFDWQINNGLTTVSADTVTATTVVFNNGGGGNVITVPDGGAGSLILSVRTNVTESAVLDNITIDLTLPNTNIGYPVISTRFPPTTINNTNNIQVIVTTTELQMITDPLAQHPVAQSFDVVTEYTDNRGNRDLDVVGDIVTATRSDAQGLNQDLSAPTVAGVANFTGANQMNLDFPANVTNTLTLILTDDVGNSVNISANPGMTSNFVLEDGTTTMAEVSSATSITSVNTYQSVWEIDLTDNGQTDTIPTIVDSVVFTATVSGGTYDATDFDWQIDNGTTTVAADTVTATMLTFNNGGGGNVVTVPDGGVERLTLLARTNITNAADLDNITINLAVSNTNFTFTPLISTTLTSSNLDNVNNTILQVISTDVKLITQPGATENIGTPFDVVAEYVDNRGNRDLDVVGDVLTATRSDAGGVTQGASAAAVAGVVNFTAANQVNLALPGSITNTLTLVLTDDVGNSIDISGNPGATTTFNLIGTDDQDSTVTEVSEVNTLGSIAGSTVLWTLRLTDLETSDGDDTIITDLVFTVTPSGTNDVEDFNWSLNTGAFAGVANNAANTVTFAGLAITASDNGVAAPSPGTQDFTLEASVKASVTDPATLESESFAVSLTTITDSAAGTSVATTSLNKTNPFNVSVAATELRMLVQPGLSLSSLPTTPQPQVEATDVNGNRDTNLVATLTAAANTVAPGPVAAVLGDRTIALAAGISVYTDLTINDVGVGYIFEFSGPALGTVQSAAFNVDPSLQLQSTALDDHDNDGDTTAGDELYFYFNDPINPATLPADNTGNQLDTLMGLSAGSFGTLATSSLPAANTIVIKLGGAGVTSLPGQTSDPTNDLENTAGAFDATQAPVVIQGAASDTFAPTATVSYSAANSSAVPEGLLTITVTFSDVFATAPTIAIDQPGTNDQAVVAMTATASPLIWTFDWTVFVEDGVANIDGLNTLSIASDDDAQGNALAQPPTNNTFTTLTSPVIFILVQLTDPDNNYTSGDTISIFASAGEAGLNVTADLSVVDTALSSTTAFTDNADGTYDLTSAALSIATLIEGAGIQIIVTATNAAGNSATFPLVVNIDDTTPTPSLLYDQPIAAVGEGTLKIILNAEEALSTVPDIAITGLGGALDIAATPMTATNAPSIFTYAYVIPAGVAGVATVSVTNVVDLVGQVSGPATNDTFTVDSNQDPVLVANAGTGQSLTTPLQVTLDAGASTADFALSFSWTQVYGPTVAITDALTTTPTVSLLLPGAYAFVVEATSVSGTGSDVVVVTVANISPYVDAGTRITLDRNEVDIGVGMNTTTVGLRASAFDANGEDLVVQWSRTDAPVGGNLNVVSPTALIGDLSVGGATIVPGSYTFKISVFDPAGTQSFTPVTDTVKVFVTAPATYCPVAHAGLDQTVGLGETVMLSSNESSDSDGVIASYTWAIVSAPAGSTATLSSIVAASPTLMPDVVGIYDISLVVQDDDGCDSDVDQMSILVNSALPASSNRIPRAVVEINLSDTDGNSSLNVGEAVTLDARMSLDADSDELTYTWRQLGGPEPLVMESADAEVQTFVPMQAGSYLFEVSVSDGKADGIKAFPRFNVMPAATTSPIVSAVVLNADDDDLDRHTLYIPALGVDGSVANPTVEIDASASLGVGLNYEWRQIGGPTVGIVNASSAVASFTPTMSRVYEFELTVVDGNGIADILLLSLAVHTYDAVLNPAGNAVPLAEVVTPVIHAFVDQPVTFYGDGSDEDDGSVGLIYQWVQTGGAPITLDRTTPQKPVFETPLAGVYTFDLFVDDGDDISLASGLTVIVSLPNSNSGLSGDTPPHIIHGGWVYTAGILHAFIFVRNDSPDQKKNLDVYFKLPYGFRNPRLLKIKYNKNGNNYPTLKAHRYSEVLHIRGLVLNPLESAKITIEARSIIPIDRHTYYLDVFIDEDLPTSFTRDFVVLALSRVQGGPPKIRRGCSLGDGRSDLNWLIVLAGGLALFYLYSRRTSSTEGP